MRRTNYNREDWRTISQDATNLQDSIIWEAILGVMEEDKSKALNKLTSTSSTLEDIYRAQGAVDAHNRDIMVLKELRRRADKSIQEAANAARDKA